jgi:hypothetical protein
VTRKSITTSHASIACDVCGRTLLRGEHADVFLHGGARRMVCELCTQRAAHEGWIREGLDDALVRRTRSGGGGRSLLGRLRARRAESDGAAQRERHGRDAPTYEEVYGTPLADPAAAFEPESQPEPEPEPDAVAPEPAHEAAAPVVPAPREPRSVHAVPTNADLKVARALDLFNASEHPRTVAGVARSLGEPIVTVRPSATEGSVVSIVVGWELSWYRYEVDLGNEAAGVRVVAKGDELTELEPEDQAPNAAAGAGGALHSTA